MLEKQFRNYFHKAAQKRGVTGENLIEMLESRLDNMLYRLGFATSRTEARQLIRHRHFAVNNRQVDIPSYLVKIGDVIQVREKSRSIARIKESVETAKQRGIPGWVEVDAEQFSGQNNCLAKA